KQVRPTRLLAPMGYVAKPRSILQIAAHEALEEARKVSAVAEVALVEMIVRHHHVPPVAVHVQVARALGQKRVGQMALERSWARSGFKFLGRDASVRQRTLVPRDHVGDVVETR